jgi:hypothetical protein
MNEPASKLATCRCQHCNGDIGFDASGFTEGETRMAECPHCHLETLIFVPRGSAKIQPFQLQGNRRQTAIVFSIIALSLIILGVLIALNRHKVSESRIKYDKNFRMVNGKIYDTRNTNTWGHLLNEAGLSGVMSGGFGMAYAVRVKEVQRNKIVCSVYRQTYRPETYTGVAQLADEEFFENIVIYHYPNSMSFVSGQDLPDCICTRVANYNLDGTSLVALDCGTNPS